MSRAPLILAAAALLAPGLAAAQAEVGDAGVAETGDAGVAETGATADVGLPAAAAAAPKEPELDEPFLPEPPAFDDADAQPAPPEEIDDGKPFGKGDMEPGAGLGFAGYGDLFFMQIGGSFAYYVVNRFAPGLEVSYGTDFGSADIPDSVTLLPFAKFVILRSARFAPYLIALGGREFEFNGYNAVHSWIVGGGGGMHIGLGAHFAIKIQVTFQHHWYDDPRIQGYEDGSLYRDANGNEYPRLEGVGDEQLATWESVPATDGTPCLVDPEDTGNYTCAVGDDSDLAREWIFPIISIGMSFSF